MHREITPFNPQLVSIGVRGRAWKVRRANYFPNRMVDVRVERSWAGTCVEDLRIATEVGGLQRRADLHFVVGGPEHHDVTRGTSYIGVGDRTRPPAGRDSPDGLR